MAAAKKVAQRCTQVPVVRHPHLTRAIALEVLFESDCIIEEGVTGPKDQCHWSLTDGFDQSGDQLRPII